MFTETPAVAARALPCNYAAAGAGGDAWRAGFASTNRVISLFVSKMGRGGEAAGARGAMDVPSDSGGQTGGTGPRWRRRCRQRSLLPKNCTPLSKKGTWQGRRRWGKRRRGRPSFEQAPRSSSHEATELGTSVPHCRWQSPRGDARGSRAGIVVRGMGWRSRAPPTAMAGTSERANQLSKKKQKKKMPRKGNGLCAGLEGEHAATGCPRGQKLSKEKGRRGDPRIPQASLGLLNPSQSHSVPGQP